MKYLIKTQDLNEFDLQIKRFMELNKNYKFINKIMFYYRKFRHFCFKFTKNESVTSLIKQLYIPKQTFYYWAKKFYDCFYYHKPFNKLLFKSTKPKNIKYFYDYHLAYQFINYFIQYRNEYGIRAFQFCYFLKSIYDEKFNHLPNPSLKTV